MFLENLLRVAKLVLILYLMVGVGFFADKIGKFTQQAAKLATGLLFYIVTPCIIVSSFITNFSSGAKFDFKDLLLAIIFFAVSYLIAIPVSKLFFKKAPAEKRSIYRHASIYGNCGFLGLPLVQAVVGDKGVLYSAIAIAVFNMLVFTQGVYQMNEGDDGKTKLKLSQIFINPGTMGIMLGIPVLIMSLVFKIDFTKGNWDILVKPLSYIGSMNTPLAMVCLGTYLANTDIKKTFTDKNNYVVSFIRLLVIPLLLFAVIVLVNKFIVGVSAVVAISLMVSTCPPSANNTVLFAATFDKDTGLASTTVAATTVFSVITVPVILALTQVVFPL